MDTAGEAGIPLKANHTRSLFSVYLETWVKASRVSEIAISDFFTFTKKGVPGRKAVLRKTTFIPRAGGMHRLLASVQHRWLCLYIGTDIGY